MSQIQKLIEKFYSKPVRNDITFSEVEKVASAFGCIIDSGGKHMRVVHVPSGSIVPIPRHGKCVGEAYIKQLKDLFDRVGLIGEE
ncbi:MAG: type II toxin-antitoxin system HicA family toxin [Ruminiclostridium sp.]|nr:type II toxin-antitoxin system HicA family toxin [Ruminiclostridium sp.]